MQCPNCKETSRIRKYDKYCHKCGWDLKRETNSFSINNTVRISKVDNRNFLQIGTELIEVTDYTYKNSADGSTEFSVSIKGKASTSELSANLEIQMK